MKDYSQNGESIILDELLEKIGVVKGSFLDIGAGNGFHLSNTRYFLEKGWKGLMIDADNKGNNEVMQLKVTKDTVFDFPEEVDLLSIDIDGNDYWVLKEYLSRNLHPKVIICEVNSQLPLYSKKVVQYDAERMWDGSHCYGMSYLAAVELLHRYGYSIYDVVNNTNIIAVKQDYNVPNKLYSFGLTYSHPEIHFNFIDL